MQYNEIREVQRSAHPGFHFIPSGLAKAMQAAWAMFEVILSRKSSGDEGSPMTTNYE
jgi:hypothetical protein